MATTSRVHVVVPDGVDDPSRPSGGNTYDRRMCGGLVDLGWAVRERPVGGAWPNPDRAARAALSALIEAIDDDEVVVVDGLIASTVPEVLVSQANRLRLVVLVHLPLGEPGPGPQGAGEVSRWRTVTEAEGAVLSAASAVITTSHWTRQRLLERYGLVPGRVHSVAPGVDPANPARGTATGGELLCVAAVTPVKGHDILLEAVASVAELPWRLTCVGALDRDAAFVARLRRRAEGAGLAERLRLVGPLAGSALDAAYATADVLVAPSRVETYGMVVTEALARGLPVIGSSVGGLPEALGMAGNAIRPGLLVPAGDPVALARALRDWLGDKQFRQRLRQAASSRAGALTGWGTTAAQVARLLSGVAA